MYTINTFKVCIHEVSMAQRCGVARTTFTVNLSGPRQHSNLDVMMLHHQYLAETKELSKIFYATPYQVTLNKLSHQSWFVG